VAALAARFARQRVPSANAAAAIVAIMRAMVFSPGFSTILDEAADDGVRRRMHI
jgi:hypothetical protein